MLYETSIRRQFRSSTFVGFWGPQKAYSSRESPIVQDPFTTAFDAFEDHRDWMKSLTHKNWRSVEEKHWWPRQVLRYGIAQLDTPKRIQDKAGGDLLTASVEMMLAYCMQRIRPPMKLVIQRVLGEKKTHCKDIETIFAAVLSQLEELGRKKGVVVGGAVVEEESAQNNPVAGVGGVVGQEGFDADTCLERLEAQSPEEFFREGCFRWDENWAAEVRARVMVAYYLWKRGGLLGRELADKNFSTRMLVLGFFHTVYSHSHIIIWILIP